MHKQSSKDRPLFLLMQGFLGIPTSKYFPNYNAGHLKTKLAGYSKAFGEYYVLG